MKTRAIVVGCLAGALMFVVVPTTADAAEPSKGGADIQSAQAEAYNGPKARIAVADFEDKMSSRGQYRPEYGRGLGDMLTTALFQTNRYIVLEREKLGAVVGELKHGTSDLFRREATAPLGELEGADLLINAAVTGFDPGVSGGNAVGGAVGNLFGGNIGRTIGTIGTIASGFGKARVAMDLRVVEVRSGRVVSATSAEGSATTFSLGGGAAGSGMGGALGGFAKTPMETAIREMIGQAVAFVVSKTPATYYRYGSDGAPVAAATQPSAPAPASPPPANLVVPAGLPPSLARATPAASDPGPARATLQTVTSDTDGNLMVKLDDVKLRGAVLSIVLSLQVKEGKTETNAIEVKAEKSHVMDYATGQTYPVITVDGFSAGRLKGGEAKTLRMTFKAPKDAKTVGIVVSGVATFDDVKVVP